MREYTLSQRQIPLRDGYDVIVVGGGPAGCAAAIGAAREGAKTLLIESSGALGGMGTGGMVPAWCPYSDGVRIIYGGISERVFTTLKEQMPTVKKSQVNWVPVESEKLKRLYDDLVTGAGAEVLFFSLLTGAETDGDGNVTALLVAGKGGLCAYRAKVYVDCTGDGDLAAYAGAPFAEGDENTGELQPATLCFRAANVDEDAYLTGENLNPGNNPESSFLEALRSGKYPHLVDSHLCQNLVGHGEVGFNANHIYGVHPEDPASLSAAMIEGRKIAGDILAALRDYCPSAFADAELSQTAALCGIRESRRILGEYYLTAEDYHARRSFPDEICRCAYYIDQHLGIEEQKKVAQGKAPAWKNREARYAPGESYGVPYRALVPKKIKNLLVAGRCISADRSVQASVRIMPACMCTGEAAGIAASLAATGGDTRTVDTALLRQKLKEYGAYLPDM